MNHQPIIDSPIYGLKKTNELSSVLGGSVAYLSRLANSNSYHVWTNNKGRLIQKPSDKLKIIQKKISNLLLNIETPSYLMCPAKNRSNIKNAKAHHHNKRRWSTDIEKFFPSVKSCKVFKFFHGNMQCSVPVSNLLTDLCLYKKMLPTGAPSSPVIAYFSYKDVWDTLNLASENYNCKFTLYADDITVSGQSIPKALKSEFYNIVYKSGLRFKKKKEVVSRDGKPIITTGVYSNNGRLAMPNKLHQKRTIADKKSKKGIDNYNNQIEKQNIRLA
jgi:hypothetical protein